MKTALGLLKAPDAHLSANTSGYETSDDPPLPPGIPPLGPIRIRNLEDILKRLQHHLQHHQPDQAGSSNPLGIGMSSLMAASAAGMSQVAAPMQQPSGSGQQQQMPGNSSSASGAGASSTTVPLSNNNNAGSSSTSHLF